MLTKFLQSTFLSFDPVPKRNLMIKRYSHHQLFGTLALSIFGLLWASGNQANAATLAPDGSGITGLEVNGNLFNVEFINSCEEAYGKCDDVSDFPYLMYADAVSLMTAIVNVLSEETPETINGCSSRCSILLPDGVITSFSPMGYLGVGGFSSQDDDTYVTPRVVVGSGWENGDGDVDARVNAGWYENFGSGWNHLDFAKVTVNRETVPEPSALLMSGAVIFLGAAVKRKSA